MSTDKSADDSDTMMLAVAVSNLERTVKDLVNVLDQHRAQLEMHGTELKHNTQMLEMRS